MQPTILPHQLSGVLDAHPKARTLSLDCFDTLLWRDVHGPNDIFDLLGDIKPGQRMRADRAARKNRALGRHSSTEVTLREIYAELLPDADADTRERHVAREIALEARHCFAFAPVVALMREAKRRGMGIIVVSDTYLERDQLEGLIRAAAGDEVVDMIDRIFCSCEYRSSKWETLFDSVLRATAKRADRILHIGDNPHADLEAGKRHGLIARHLVQFAAPTVQRLRQETVAGALLTAGGTAFQPHRAALAIGEPTFADPGEAFGFGVLGPIFTTFAKWIAAEATAPARGKTHPLFLMRDGHLPCEMVSATEPGLDLHKVEISRFAAIASTMRNEDAVRRFVRNEIGDGAGRVFLRQLMIDGDEAEALLAGLPKASGQAPLALAEAVLSDAWLPKIQARGRAYADRLVAYLRTIFDPAPGDTVMLVDIGYNATVQNHIEPLLREAFGVDVIGRYLVLNEELPSGRDKRGLIGPDHFDHDALHMLTSSIVMIEQFCTVAKGSVIDYTADGAPIHAAAGIKGRQNDVCDAAQRGCIAYVGVARDAVIRVTDPGEDMHRAAAAATLARLLYLPLPNEVALVERFENDANLGSDQKTMLFDATRAERGLRESGLFYINDARRYYVPAEIRGQGLTTSLTLMAKRRFSLGLHYADFCDRDIAVQVLVADGTEAFVDTIRATPTHDGWFVAAVPVGACRYTVGLQFGRDHEWLQIDSARFLPVAAFLSGEHRAEALAVPALPSCEGMEQTAPHLFHCADPDAFLMAAAGTWRRERADDAGGRVPPDRGARDRPGRGGRRAGGRACRLTAELDRRASFPGRYNSRPANRPPSPAAIMKSNANPRAR